jgi:UDP-2,3-diacylglucosamine pyrophosphatase LpxH
MADRDIVVVSDLHLGRGKNPNTGRYYRLEAFFFDDDFEAFCRWLCAEAETRKTGVTLVLNGDTFDLLRIEPHADDKPSQHSPQLTPAAACGVLEDIVEGHPTFFTGLARLLVAGHHVVFTPGNHDLEIQWECVQNVVRDALLAQTAELADEAAAAHAGEQIRFEPWFYYEPGRIWIEHGCQYDPENAFQYPLRAGIENDDKAVAQAERDLPMGTVFQRYLYNGFGNITFIVPNSRSNLRYFRWLILNKPRLLARITFSQVPFFLQVLRTLAKSAGSTERVEDAHEAELDRIAKSSGLEDKAYLIDDFKQVRGSAAVVTRGIILQILKVFAFTVITAFVGAGLWFSGFYAINEIEGGFGFKAVLFLTLNFLFLLIAAVTITLILLRAPSGPSSKRPRRAAKKIANALDVPLVTFGHTHDEVIWRFDRDGGDSSWFFNTGTWIAVFTSDELVPRERVQYTFLRVRDKTGELLRWSPGRNEASPVILLQEAEGLEAGMDRPSDAQAS